MGINKAWGNSVKHYYKVCGATPVFCLINTPESKGVFPFLIQGEVIRPCILVIGRHDF